MTPPLVAAHDPRAVDRVVAVLDAGGVVVLPTDTVYGVAARADRPAATGRLLDLKGRSASVPVAVLCADAAQALALARSDARLQAVAGRWWPGPLTLVARRAEGVRYELGEPAATIGLRCPAHDLVRAVAARSGPIATTSANRHGQPTPPAAAEAAASLLGPVDLVVDGGTLRGTASTVVDTSRSPWRILREGPIPAAQVLVTESQR